MHELEGVRSQLKTLQRTMGMLVHNTAVLSKALVAVNEDLVDELHPETTGSSVLQEF